MGRKLSIDETAVAQAVLTSLLNEDQLETAFEAFDTTRIAEHVLDAAEVEYKPTARKLVLTFDLSGPVAESKLNAEYAVTPVPIGD